jgi:hypothetical protein
VTTLVKHSEFSLLADLAREGALTSTALTLDPETRYETWEAIGGLIGGLNRSVAWLAGDWAEHGERAYGEKYAQAVDETGLAPQTLMNYASVCRRVPPERRRASLPFSSHAVVAKLPAREQERWLKRAEKEGWTRRELEAQVKGETPEVATTIRDLASAVWLAAQPMYGPISRDGMTHAGEAGQTGYFVPAEPMKALGDAL